MVAGTQGDLMDGRAKAYRYREPETRFQTGGVFTDDEHATDWVHTLSTSRSAKSWRLEVRSDHSWMIVAQQPAAPSHPGLLRRVGGRAR